MAVPVPQKKRIALDGVVLLDKPVGLSSNQALVQVKRGLQAQKAGHTGTLDPFATGLLPLCLGEATKFAQDLLNADKTYEAVIHMGIRTTTGDTEGEVIETKDSSPVSFEAIKAVLRRFTGAIEQVPPIYSALKHEGKPLYEYARAGIEIKKAARLIHIHELELLDFSPPFLKVRVHCSKGTYIRVLGEDIGHALGTVAHLHELRRTKVGPLSIEAACTLNDFAVMAAAGIKEMIKPVDYLLSSLPAVFLNHEQSRRFLHGQRLSLEKEGIALAGQPQRIRVYADETQTLLGTATLRHERTLAPERLIAFISTPN